MDPARAKHYVLASMSAPATAPPDAWTGGQHSVVRFAFGLWIAWRLALAMNDPPYPWSLGESGASELGMRLILVAGVLLALAFAAGLRERWCALGLAALAVSLPFQQVIFLGNVAALLLVVLALFPEAPYGSWDARGRTDPAGGWARPCGTSTLLLVLLGAILLWSALVDLAGPDEPSDRRGPDALLPLLDAFEVLLGLAFLPLLAIPKARPWLWAAAFAVHLYWTLPHPSGFTFLCLFAFDPAWLAPRPRRGTGEETIFYDGECGLCHRSVRFVLSEDAAARFVYAPLASEAFAPHRPSASELGDTMVLVRGDGTLASRSDAWIEILAALGGGWRMLAEGFRVLPRKLRDGVYDQVARVRKRLFAKPQGACPLLSPELARRFRA